MSDLIDTTEMYLRTIYELREEGIPPLRARIAERLGQSGPTVSQTTARMERDGLLVVAPDRTIQLTDQGLLRATRVMRKHRLAERLLADVIGLDWAKVHEEACRWEHVMSEQVEVKLIELLGHPTVSPFGNPIPGLDELDPDGQREPEQLVVGLGSAMLAGASRCVVARIPERLQEYPEVISALGVAGIRPGTEIEAQRLPDGRVTIAAGGAAIELDEELAELIGVSARPAPPAPPS